MPRLSNSDRGGGSPHVERFLSEGAKRMAGCEIALDVDPNFKTHREALESGAALVNQTVVSDPRLPFGHVYPWPDEPASLACR